jgi:hypothetical protein
MSRSRGTYLCAPIYKLEQEKGMAQSTVRLEMDEFFSAF